ncbi:hypothetical protein [Fluviicola taffensis]|uniref:Uncharacterized protein n=1 Tax=Fluviicola taffensis (strain DSM 16823 / NCIMB 13979 / RW262) TaxID=755732 RepID=F2ICJ3_FLUTR|nr:hypothetical protein [Fluviicola taffensis]AEA45463.1 hypothetical protein Fluta_3492 [Fluviicola taffensis DSM 16823]
MLDFFQQRFSYVHQLNLSWISHLMKDDRDIPWDLKVAVSQLINSQHIAVCEILDLEIESDLNDVLPEMHWESLERENYKQWMTVFLQFNQGLQDNVEWLTPLLFKSLHENAQYIGQLKLLLAQHELEQFDETLIRVE